MALNKEEKDEYFDVLDNNSVGEDSGFSTGEDDKHSLPKVSPVVEQEGNEQVNEEPKQEDNSQEIEKLVTLEPDTRNVEEKPELDEEDEQAANFLYRIASIPIIQDSYVGAQNIVRQHTVGQRALDFAETKLQPVLVSAYHTTLFSHANNLGNKSLDLLEKQFPAISSPTQDLLQPIKGRLDHAISLLKPSEPVDRITLQFEHLLNYYLPSEPEPTIEEHGVQRLLKVSQILADRITKKVMSKVSAGKEEEERVRSVVKTWITEKSKSMLEKQPVFVQDLVKEKTLQSEQLHQFTLAELEKVRQELNKQTSNIERVKSIWNLSRNDIIVPLFQKSSSLFYRKQATAA
ncbi:unnamed protein product [Rhizopus stolonifer]